MKKYYAKTLKTQMSGKLRYLLLLFGLLLSNILLHAEGTKQASSNFTAINALLIAPDVSIGSFYNTAEVNRVKFYINDNVNESLDFGFDGRGYTITAPIVFAPTAKGEYFTEMWGRATTLTINSGGIAAGAFFNFTVVNNSDAFTQHDGRVYFVKRGFNALTPITFLNSVSAISAPVLYTFINDQPVVKIEFRNGFEPIASNVAKNKFGVYSSVSCETTRKSFISDTTPSLSNGFKLKTL